MVGSKHSSDRTSNGSIYSASSESRHGNSRSSTESLFSNSNMTESQLSEMRLSRFFVGTPDSTLHGRSLSFDINLKERQGSQRMQNTLDDWESYFETVADEGYSMITKAPSSQDFEEAKAKVAAARGYTIAPQDKIELQSSVDQFKARMPGFFSSFERLLDARDFNTLHFEVIVPYLKECLKQRVGPGVSIGVAEKDGHRIIQIMTHKEVDSLLQLEVGEVVVELLTLAFRDRTRLQFARGQLIRSVDGIGEIQSDKPKNTYQYNQLEMGDSIGSDKGVGVSTAGPKVLLGNVVHRVNCWHMWEKFYEPEDRPLDEHPDVHHPSRDVDVVCKHTGPSSFAQPQEVGKVVLASGYDIKTTRVSDHPFFKARSKSWKSVMDWTVSTEKNSPRTANVVRMTGMPRVEEDITITATSTIEPDSYVYSSGRSSGLQLGHVRETPTFMDGAWNKTDQDTWEWTVEQAMTDMDEIHWVNGGLGIAGDSGAAVFNLATHSLCGQVWATAIDEKGHRVTYISDWLDIAGHIKETHRKHLSPELPKLPQHHRQKSSEPICVDCAAERVEYLKYIEPISGMIRDSRPPPPMSDDSSATCSAAGSPVSEASTPDDQEMSDAEKHVSGSRSSLRRSTALRKAIPTTNADTKAVINASNKKVTKDIVNKFVEKLPPILDEGFFTEPDSMMPQAPQVAEQVQVAAVA